MFTSIFSVPIRLVVLGFLSLCLVALGGCVSTGNKVPERGGSSILGIVDPCNVPLVTCVKVVLPPLMVAAGGMKRVAVVAGTGQGASSLATQLEKRLSAVVVDDKPFYTLVRPNDPTRQATFEVSSSAWEIDEQRETQTRTKCKDWKCKVSSEYKVSCTVRKATVGVLIRLRGKDGSELATRDAGGVGDSKKCQGESGTLDAAPLVFGKATGKAMDVLQDALAVRTALKRVRIIEDAAGVTDAGRKRRFFEAVEFAKAGRMDRACPMFSELSEVETSSVAVFYNLGFCDQVNGDWRSAFRYYNKADSNASKPLSEITEALAETRQYGVQK
jgi:hypothetical protein